MPPESAARHLVALVRELQQRQVFLGALARQLPRNAVEAGLVHQDGLRRLELVEIDFLRHDADAGLGGLQLAVEVVAEHADGARGLVDQRGEDADQRGLAGAVRPEQCEEVPLLHVEIDPLEGLDTVLVGLRQSANRQCVHGAVSLRFPAAEINGP